MKQQLAFTKMQGLGNDFIVIDAISQKIKLTTKQIRFLADRRFGVGCDQILLIEPATQKNIDFFYRIYNADGSEVAQCGNGARCIAKFLYNHGYINKRNIKIATKQRALELYLEANGQVTVNMGLPITAPQKIPLLSSKAKQKYKIAVANDVVEVGALSLGNPHAVLQVQSVVHAPVGTMGALLVAHPNFPEGVNVNFMQVIDRSHIRLRVFERGVGETLACGSGACAAVIIGHIWKLLGNRVQVELPGGILQVKWQGGKNPVYLTGPAEHVFDGSIMLQNKNR
jgi:diaminopimelate epimerase